MKIVIYTKSYRVLFITLMLTITFGILRKTKPIVAQPVESPVITSRLGNFSPERDGFRFTNTELSKEIYEEYYNAISLDSLIQNLENLDSRILEIEFEIRAHIQQLSNDSIPEASRNTIQNLITLKQKIREDLLGAKEANLLLRESRLRIRDIANQYNTLIMEFMFGKPNVCLDDTVNNSCVLTPPAQRWLDHQISFIQHGICEGMVLSSLHLWLGRHNDANWNQPESIPFRMESILGGRENWASGIDIENISFRFYSTTFFMLQSLTQVSQDASNNREKLTPSQMLEMIDSALQEPQYDLIQDDDRFDIGMHPLYTIGIYQRNNDELTEGHTLLPYKVLDVGDNKKHVLVYDSNYVYASESQDGVTADKTYIEFEGNRWSYKQPATKVYSGNETTKNLDISLVSKRYPDRSVYTCTFCKGGSSRVVDINFYGSGDLTITNLKDQTLERADNPSRGGLGVDVPASYLLPTDASYQINLSGIYDDDTQQREGDLALFGSGYMLGLLEVALRPDSELVAYINHYQHGPEFTFEAKTPEEQPTMFVSADEDNIGYDIFISGVNLSTNQGVVLSLDSENRRLYFADNNGIDDNYRLTIKRTTSQGEETITVEVPLPANEAAYLDYGSWIQYGSSRQEDTLSFYFTDANRLIQANNKDYLSLDISQEINASAYYDEERQTIRRGGGDCKSITSCL